VVEKVKEPSLVSLVIANAKVPDGEVWFLHPDGRIDKIVNLDAASSNGRNG